MKFKIILLAFLLTACAAPSTPTTADSEIVFITATPSPVASALSTDEALPFRDLSTPTPTETMTPIPTDTPIPTLTLTPAPIVAAATALPLPGIAATLPAAPMVSMAIPLASQPVVDVASAEQAVIDLVNKNRGVNGLPTLARSEANMSIARWRSADMVARNYFGHNDPVTFAHLAHDAVLAAGFGRAGENIYWSSRASLFDFADQAVAWFMGSSAHRANILNSGYTAIGVGITWNGVGWVLAQVFGG